MRGAAVVLIMAALLLPGCGKNMFSGIADKNSSAANQQQISQDLDSGNYAAVVNSPNAGAMQKGAAWFGIAGFNIGNVVTGFTNAASSGYGDAGINAYIKDIVPKVTSGTLAALDNAAYWYSQITNSASADGNDYLNAQFNLGIVKAAKSLSFMGGVLDTLGAGGGILNTTCSANGALPDGAAAASCALLVAEGATSGNSCGASLDATFTNTPDAISLYNGDGSGPYPGQYWGLTIAPSVANSACPSKYQKLLAQNPGGSRYVVTTTSNTCYDQPKGGNPWPCPVVENGQAGNLVQDVFANVVSSVGILNSVVQSDPKVQQAITNIENKLCSGGSGCPQDLLEQNLASYIQKLTVGH